MESRKNYKQSKTGDLIKELRKSAGYTQEGLAEKIGCSTQTISNIECGKYISADIAVKLSSVFHVPADYILGKIETPDEYARRTLEAVSILSRAAEAQETLVEYLVASENNKKLKLTEAEKQELTSEMIWYGRMRLRKIISERSGSNGEESKKSR